MMTTVRGHFNGVNIVLDETVELLNGQEVFVTIAENAIPRPEGQKPDLHRFVVKDEPRMLDRDAAEAIREERNNDRA